MQGITSTCDVCIPIDHLSTGVQGARTLVISARAFHGGEIFVILSRVYQVRDISHLGMGVLRKKVARRYCHMPAIPPLFLFSHHLCFSSHSNITFSRIFPAFEHYFFPRPPSLVIKLHTYLDRATYMYATGA